MADLSTTIPGKSPIGRLALLLAAATMGAVVATLVSGFQDVDGRVADGGKALVHACPQVEALDRHWQSSEGRTRIAPTAGCDARRRQFVIDPALLIKPILRGA